MFVLAPSIVSLLLASHPTDTRVVDRSFWLGLFSQVLENVSKSEY